MINVLWWQTDLSFVYDWGGHVFDVPTRFSLWIIFGCLLTWCCCIWNWFCSSWCWFKCCWLSGWQAKKRWVRLTVSAIIGYFALVLDAVKPNGTRPSLLLPGFNTNPVAFSHWRESPLQRLLTVSRPPQGATPTDSADARPSWKIIMLKWRILGKMKPDAQP